MSISQTRHNDNMVDRALELARAGYCVHPLRAGTKRARFEVWQELATTDEQTIRQWWALHPDDNIGIGIKASGLLIVTPDCADRLTDFQQRNGRAGAPDTMRVQSRQYRVAAALGGHKTIARPLCR